MKEITISEKEKVPKFQRGYQMDYESTKSDIKVPGLTIPVLISI